MISNICTNPQILVVGVANSINLQYLTDTLLGLKDPRGWKTKFTLDGFEINIKINISNLIQQGGGMLIVQLVLFYQP